VACGWAGRKPFSSPPLCPFPSQLQNEEQKLQDELTAISAEREQQEAAAKREEAQITKLQADEET
jgi:hypothetical protein